MKEINTKQPLVSVIMPTYNHAQFIGEAIDSVLNQTYNNLELIIIDNYSKDNTAEIVASYKDDRIKYLKFKNNGVIAASRNYGIKHSQGEYIAFLDSDDMWLPEKLEKQINIFKASNKTSMLYTRFRTIEGDIISNRIFPKNGKYKSGDIFKALYCRSFIACSSVIVKRSVLDQVGFFDTDPDLVAIEDTDLWLRIALKYIVRCTDSLPLLIYRIQPQSISYGCVQNIRRSLIIKKRYKKYAGNYLFWISVILSISSICGRKLLLRLYIKDKRE